MPDVAAIFDREAENWDAAHGPESPRAGEFAARAAYLHALCGRLGKPRVLDMGCGTGRQLLELAGAIDAGVGLDLSEGMIAQARQNASRCGAPAKFEFRVGEIASAAPAALGRFGLILFVGSLEHAPDPAAPLAAASGLLEASGRLVVIMPHPWNPGVLMSRSSAGEGAPLRHLTPRRLASLAARSGLGLESVRGLPYRSTAGGKGESIRRWPVAAGAYAACFALA
jgi:SAM-dependent methyltransferase